MRVLITGSNGQLGSEFKELHTEFENIEYIFKDLPELDICDIESLNSFIVNENINAIVNCAAYTAVDKAEENAEIAARVNSTGVCNLVEALNKVNGKLIHISTDYVFDGNNSRPYVESDPVCPVCVYGETKRDGELAVINSKIDGIVIRTSWLYSTFGNNFLKTIFRIGKEKQFLNVISDQIGTPTYARDLAKVCLEILSLSHNEKINKNGKIYHYSNEGLTSWYDFAVTIMEIAGMDCKVQAIQTKDYPTLAKRPHYSVLNKTKIKEDFNIEIPHWKESLKDCINKFKL